MSGQQQLGQELIANGVLRTPAIIDAFFAIDRADFVTKRTACQAYNNTPLPIGYGQTVSQPYTVAYMLELLKPKAEDNILDIGYGSGWQTALLAHIVGPRGHITALEVIPPLCAWGRCNLNKYNFISRQIVTTHCQSAVNGFVPAAPYDKIIAAAAAPAVPSAWLEQTKIGGTVVAPVKTALLRLTKTGEEQWTEEQHPGFVFVPLVS